MSCSSSSSNSYGSLGTRFAAAEERVKYLESLTESLLKEKYDHLKEVADLSKKLEAACLKRDYMEEMANSWGAILHEKLDVAERKIGDAACQIDSMKEEIEVLKEEKRGLRRDMAMLQLQLKYRK
jgi:chromosome segregation ATPase